MLLNKIPVLDKGYVALISSCNTTKTLRDLGQEFYGGEYPQTLEQLGHMTVAIKCPLFVQLAISKFNMRIVDANRPNHETEAYKPNAGEIQCRDRLDSQAISDDISRTTDALLLNPKAYEADGAGRFVSQVITPISVYTTIIVQGEYSEWCKLAYDRRFPPQIAHYCSVLQQIIEAEWK